MSNSTIRRTCLGGYGLVLIGNEEVDMRHGRFFYMSMKEEIGNDEI